MSVLHHRSAIQNSDCVIYVTCVLRSGSDVDHDPPDVDQSGADDHSHPGGHAASIDEAFNVTTTAGVDEVANTSTTTAGVYETANASSTFRTGH